MPRPVGINHVAVEVGSIDEALAFLEQLFGELQLRGRGPSMAFVDLGDQFIALSAGRTQPPDADATSASSSTDGRKPSSGRERPAPRCWRTTTSSTPGAITGRSSTTATSSSQTAQSSSGMAPRGLEVRGPSPLDELRSKGSPTESRLGSKPMFSGAWMAPG